MGEPATDVELWIVRTADLDDAEVQRACAALLSPEENVRKESYRFERNRREYLATRALCRSVLASHVGGTASSLSFEKNPHGRPELVPSGGLSFNLSNTTELIVCVVGRDRVVGVDVESLARAPEILEVAHTVFTPAERERMRATADAARNLHAVTLWTAKEAYMKARGLGLSLPPLDVEIEITAAAGIRVVAGNADDTHAWDFQTRVFHEHVITTCVEVTAAAAAMVLRDVALGELVLGGGSS